MRLRPALLALLIVAPPARGHPLKVSRSLVLELDGAGGAHALFRLTVPRGRPRAVAELLADRDKDGRLTGAERAELEAMLALRALDGVQLRVGGSTVSLGRVEAKHEAPPGEGIELLVLGHLPLPSGRTILAVSTGASADPLELTMLARRGALESPRRGRTKGRTWSAALGAGDRVEVGYAP